MGTGEFNAGSSGDDLRWTSIPSRGRGNTPGSLMLGNRDKLQMYGCKMVRRRLHLWSYPEVIGDTLPSLMRINVLSLALKEMITRCQGG